MDTTNGVATIEYVVQVCNNIFNDIKEGYRKAVKVDEKFCDELHADMIKKYKEFGSMYPIVLRHMVYEKKFYPEVMKKFLLHVSNHPIKSREESLEVQAEYLVFMMRHEYPKQNVQRIYEYRNYVVKELKDNDKKLADCIEEAAKEMRADKEMGQQERRERIREYLMKQLKAP